jgi:hypothetical protein
MERKVLVDIRHHALRILQKRDERLRLQGIQLTKKRYVDLQQFAAILLPPESAIFYPDGKRSFSSMIEIVMHISHHCNHEPALATRLGKTDVSNIDNKMKERQLWK